MDHMLNEIPQEEAPQRRRRKSRKRLALRLPGLLQYIGQDVRWFYDVRLWSPVILVLLILALLLGRATKAAPVEAPLPPEPIMETVPEVTQEPIIPEAEALARLAESVGAGRSDNVKTIIMWVAINRSEDRSNGYGLSLLEEIARANQWQGYDENIPYTSGTYQMAKDVLDIQRRGALRPLDSDMLWFILNDNGSISVRNQFTKTNAIRWREKTVN